jgi:hypothetical protein
MLTALPQVGSVGSWQKQARTERTGKGRHFACTWLLRGLFPALCQRRGLEKNRHAEAEVSFAGAVKEGAKMRISETGVFPSLHNRKGLFDKMVIGIRGSRKDAPGRAV